MFRRCKIPVLHELSVVAPLKHFTLYTCIVTVLLFFISMNLIVFNVVIVNIAIALMMQNSISSVILYSFMYI